MMHWRISAIHALLPHLAWMLPYVVLACGLVATLLLFLSIKREMLKTAARSRERMETILRRLEEAQAREPEPVYAPVAPRSGLNISNRAQAMRMLRRNQDISHISAALGVPRKEVELLIRVQKMAAGG